MSAKAQRLVRICNKRGLHARPSRKFAETAIGFKSAITVRREDEVVDATSLMDLMMLGAGLGSELEITAEGEDAEAAVAALAGLVEDRFGEGE